MAQDRLLEGAERLSRFEPELVRKKPVRLPVDLKRLHLATIPVEREHQMAAQPLAERVSLHQSRQLGNEQAISERELDLDPAFQGERAEFLEPPNLSLRELLAGEIGERVAAPEPERAAKQRGRFAGLCVS